MMQPCFRVKIIHCANMLMPGRASLAEWISVFCMHVDGSLYEP